MLLLDPTEVFLLSAECKQKNYMLQKHSMPSLCMQCRRCCLSTCIQSTIRWHTNAIYRISFDCHDNDGEGKLQFPTKATPEMADNHHSKEIVEKLLKIMRLIDHKKAWLCEAAKKQ